MIVIINCLIKLLWSIETRLIFFGTFFHSQINIDCVPKLIRTTCDILVSKDSKLHIGKRFAIREYSKIECGEGGVLSIGDDVFFNRGCIVTCLNRILIGNRSIFGPNCLLFDHDHKYNELGLIEGELEKGEIIIGDKCWFGANVIILKNAKIGDGCIIAANTVIRAGEIPAHSFVYGNDGKYKDLRKMKK